MTHPLAQAFARAEPIGPDDPFPFTCRGCGQRCCVNTDVLVSPPEAARISWHLARRSQLAHLQFGEWGALFIGGATGLPLVRLDFVPVAEQLAHCPFLVPLFSSAGEWQQQAGARSGKRDQRCAGCSRLGAPRRSVRTSTNTGSWSAAPALNRRRQRRPAACGHGSRLSWIPNRRRRKSSICARSSRRT